MIEVAALVLAAGRGSRFAPGAGDSKVLADLGGRALIEHVVAAALASGAAATFVVAGHAAPAVAAKLAGSPVTLVLNRDYAGGLAGSLKAGIAALPQSCAGALVLLGDMPLVKSGTLDHLIAAFRAGQGVCDAVVPLYQGRRGNPVLLSRRQFAAIAGLEGDEGARQLLARPDVRVLACAVDDSAILLDIDTRDALAAVRLM